MTRINVCPECGAELPGSSPGGYCPACLLKRGLETNTAGYTGANTAQPSPAARWLPPAVDELAARFPELQITHLIGRGGMGAVYQARQISLDRVVALKILPPEMAHDPAFAERFAREAQAMARLNHPHIVTIHEFGQRGGWYYFLMECVDGVSLRGLLDSGHLSPKEAMAIVPQICDALQYAHDQGIIHRDIKPENILLNKQGQVKIADFGLAKLIGRNPVAGAAEKVMGTPQYMAPEQLDRPADVDHRADIYSLGVVFYQMLTGELPVGKFAPPSRKVQIDVRLDEVVLRALEKEPEKRYQQVSQVKTEVETIAQTTVDAASHAPPRRAGIGIDLESERGSNRPPGRFNKFIPLAPSRLGIGRALLWAARILGVLWLLVLALFVFGIGLAWLPQHPVAVFWEYLALALMVAGFIAGWFSAKTAAQLLVLGWIIYRVAEGVAFSGRGPIWPPDLAAIIGTIFLIAYWLLAPVSRWRAAGAIFGAACVNIAVLIMWLGGNVASTSHLTWNQTEINDLQPDGMIRCQFTSDNGNLTHSTWTTFVFHNSDFVHVETISDASGRPIPFTTQHDQATRKYAYTLTLPQPVPPGQVFTMVMQETVDTLVRPTGEPGVFEYHMNHSPGIGGDTRRIEVHRLPVGAQLLEKSPSDLVQSEKDGRIELRIDRIIPPGGRLDIRYRYRLVPAATQPTAPIPVQAARAYTGDINDYRAYPGEIGPTVAATQAAPGQPTRLTVTFAVPEGLAMPLIKEFRAGKSFPVTVFNREMGKIFARGTITHLDNAFDPQTGTLRCGATVRSEPEVILLTNQFVNVRILLDTKHGVTIVPASAIQFSPASAYVYLTQPDRTVARREVRLGLQEGDKIEIKSGLSPGDVVVTGGVDRVFGGAKVSYELPAPDPAQPANGARPGTTATLPSGVKVELVGISENPSHGKPWWASNGSPLPRAPYAFMHGSVTAQEDQVAREVVVRLENLPAVPASEAWEFIPEGSTCGSSLVEDAGGRADPALRAIAVDLPSNISSFTVRFGLATGAWNTIADSASAGGDFGARQTFSYAFGRWVETDQGVSISVAFNHTKDASRVVAIDVNGQTHTGGFTSGGTGELTQTTVTFPGLRLAQIKKVELQIRPYEWVEFRNVSLQSGHKTQPSVNVKIDASQPATSPSSATQPAASAAEAKVTRDLLANAEATLKDAKSRYERGLTNSVEYVKAERDRDVAAAQVRGDTDAIPGIQFKYADEIYRDQKMRYERGIVNNDELLQAEKDRLIAAAATQPTTAAPTTSPDKITIDVHNNHVRMSAGGHTIEGDSIEFTPSTTAPAPAAPVDSHH